MSKVKIRVTADDVESAEGGGEFELPPVGLYVAEMTECKAGFKKAEGGGEDRNAPRIECTYKILGSGRDGKAIEGKNYGQFWDYVTFSEAAGWKRAEFLKAMGLPVQAKGGEFEVDTDDCVGKKVVVKIKHENDRQANDGSKRARISNVYPFVDGDSEAAFGGSTSDDEPADDADVFGSDDDAGDDDELLTEEALNEMDLKELGGIAAEFDLDPKDFIVKVRGKLSNDKTKESIIAGILEAQGGDDEEQGDDSGDDDEDPF